MSLRYGETVEAGPPTRLCGWFERHLTFWGVHRWLELNGSTLTYRHREHGPVVWICDLRETQFFAGSNPCELVLCRNGIEPLSLFAPTLKDLKIWFAQMKKVSDGVHDFYHFSAKAGRTRYGVIHLGCDKKDQEDVAIYTVEKGYLPLQKVLILAKRDLAIVEATQTHDSIVRVVDLFESSMRFYIVTELINGGTLSSFLAQPLPEAIVIDMMADILQGLQHLHSREIVHGNLDPESIVCLSRRPPCRVKIVAYGNAAARRDVRLLGGASLKNWQQLAPEVVCFQRRTTASDVFAAGSLMYRMLSGMNPFKANNEAAYLACVSRGISVEDNVWDGISNEAKSLVHRMLDDDASVRPSASDCLNSAWFRDSIGDADPAESRDEILRMQSDPKTVIMDFEQGRSFGGHAISRNKKVDTYSLSYGN